MHARTLEMLGGLFALERGGDLFTRDGRTLTKARLLDQPGSCRRSRRSPRRAPRACTEARSPKRSCASTESSSRADDLAGYRPLWRDSDARRVRGRRVATRGGLSGVPELLPRLPQLGRV